ncbi:polysaccharide pyruvyl transferase family protein [Herbaspirillum sp. LeCh32-8]|uniref:polysaccharide pyruvyl transferase family protein n=1 Tax=Herbaspirillum sp. LeCh32-8 TaxID=2821356 RepID=UPI001AE3F163|nr:polysaccharide pyruvyl transferase family protein [Herbaspirillum sp. LeCh32-8]MBP0596919.1 polysaccharide pyruvyl transferase family protein [Herbaspirillum sp. LeCh32-8]
MNTIAGGLPRQDLTQEKTTMQKHQEIMQDLKLHHEAIAAMLKGQRFHYIDIPVHDNIGDLLIMLGTVRFFKDHGLTPATVSNTYYFDHKWVRANDILVFHGGGNFGDIYGNIHALREKLISAFPNNRIILMPQTLFFSSPEARASSAQVIRRHPDLHLFVRDTVSEKMAHEFTDKVYLVPDMAHHLYPIQYAGGAAQGNVRIQRVDPEKPKTPDSLRDLPIRTTTDWVEVIGDERKLMTLFAKLEWRFDRYGWDRALTRLALWFWVPVSRRFVRKAVRLFADHETIVTDRLHGHILSCLMDKKNIVIDNSYGKNSTYMNQWTRESPLTTLVKE